MEAELPLDRMTTSDKLRVLEIIWDDLQHTAAEIPSPSWHADVLRAREQRVQEGKSQFQDWTDAKGRIQEHTQ